MMSEMLFVPLNGVPPIVSPAMLFALTLLILALPMFVAMSGVLLLKWTEINTKLPGSAWWLYPVFYAGFPAGILLYNLHTSPDMFVFSISILSILAVLAPPVFGFLQAVFLDPEKNGIYLFGLVVNLLSLWCTQAILTGGELMWGLLWVLFSSFAIYCVSLYCVSIKERATRQKYDLVPSFFLTIIFSPTLVVGLLLIRTYEVWA